MSHIKSRKHGRNPVQARKPLGIASVLAGSVLALPVAAQLQAWRARGAERMDPVRFAFLDALKIAKLAVSLGGTETLASAPAAMTHLSVPDERKLALGITDNLVRISIGVETTADEVERFATIWARVISRLTGP